MPSLPAAVSVGTAAASWLWLLGTTLAGRDASLPLTTVCLVAALGLWARALLPGRADRLPWGLVAAGCTGYAGGYAVLFLVTAGEGGGPGGLNYSDCLSLLLYPAGLAGLVLLTRNRLAEGDPRAVLDGVVVALATVAASVAVTAHLAPAVLRRGVLDAVYTFAYPIGSLLLIVTAGCCLVVLRFHLDRVWLLVLAACSALFTGQLVYAVQAADGRFSFGTPLDAVYAAGPLLLVVAAWSRSDGLEPQSSSSSRTVMVLTAGATCVALGVLLDRSMELPSLAVVLAGAAVLAAVARTVLLLRQDELLAVRTHQALTDPLTGLANRRALLDHLARLVGDDTPAATLVLVDLDRFKGVNDSLGHLAGDELLRLTAQRLLGGGAVDGLISRLGGDEFALVLPYGIDRARVRAALAREQLQKPYVLVDGVVSVGATFGLACTADLPPGAAPLELLRRADVALYRGKQVPGGIECWSPAIDRDAREQLVLAAELRSALAGTELTVHLQPKCDARSGRIRATEALVRWQHPVRGLLAPAQFLHIAESAGLLSSLTSVVLEVSLRMQAELRAAGHDVPVAVNISAADLLDSRFPSRVAQALDHHRLPASCLRLEVTETVVLSDPARVVRNLDLLRRLGIGLSLDDYGTGLSSLTYLRELPVDELKIDRSFVSDLLTSRASLLITTSTIELAHALGLRVVAEGVEDDATRAALADLGCDLVQGFHLGRPAPLDALLSSLDRAAVSASLPRQDPAPGVARAQLTPRSVPSQ